MSADQPRVSIIIPTCNRSRLLQMAVESALGQTYPHVETIVVDDGSTDDTAERMAQYAGRVTYLKQARRGVAAARNAGFRGSSGAYVTFLDDGDLILPAKIARQAQVLNTQPDTGLAHCDFYYGDQNGNRVLRAGFLPAGEVLGELVRGNFVWVGAPLIRRQCFYRTGLFDETVPPVSADWDMWLRLAQAGYHFAYVPEALGVYRIQPDSMMTDVITLERGMFTVLDKVFSSPYLPAPVAAGKPQAYGLIHLWVSCRCYAAHQWDAARRNLTEALNRLPYLLDQPAELARLICDDALSPRVEDAVQFVTDVLEHLPLRADVLRLRRSTLLGRVYTELALRNYGIDAIVDARRQLAQAVAADPEGTLRVDDFARSLSHYALHLPVDSPIHYVHKVIQNLPAQAAPLAQAHMRVLSEVNIGCAFEDYFAGHRWQATRRIFAALRCRPAWLSHRGVVSLLLRSLLGLRPTQHGWG